MNRLMFFNCWIEPDDRHVGPFVGHNEHAPDGKQFLDALGRAADFVDATRSEVTIFTESESVTIKPEFV
jgi:hypothetical protein